MPEEKPKEKSPEEAGEKKEVEIEIIDRTEITMYPEPGVEQPTVVTTFRSAGYPPLMVYIPKEEFTKEKEDEEMRKSLKAYKPFKPEKRKITL